MQTNKYFLLILITSSILFLAFNKSSNTYQTECVSIETNGYITIKIWDTKLGKSYKPEQARKDAIHAILFSGISGTEGCIAQNALLINSDAKERFKKIEKDFFSNNSEWQNYVRSADTETTLPESIGEKKWKVFQVIVAKDALRKNLEEKQIMKSLNTGF